LIIAPGLDRGINFNGGSKYFEFAVQNDDDLLRSLMETDVIEQKTVDFEPVIDNEPKDVDDFLPETVIRC
jgi:hypothetical protein